MEKEKTFQKILDQMELLSSFDFSKRIPVSSDEDTETSALAHAINSLADKLESKFQHEKANAARINNIIDILMEYTIMDFSKRIKLSDKRDEIDAIAAGLNTLAEELSYYKKEEEKYAEELKKANHLLENNIQKLHAIFDNTPDAIIASDMNFRIIEWNKASEKLYGYSKEEVVGKSAEDIISTEYQPPFSRKEASNAMLLRGVWNGEFQQKTARRKKMTVLSSLCFLKDEHGNNIGYLGINRDVTEERKKEKALKASEQKFRMLLESAPDAMVIVNEKGEIILINSQTEKLFGYSRDEMYGKTIELLIPSRFHTKHEGHRKNYFKEPKVRSMGAGLDLLGKKKNGTEFSVEISLSPLHTEQGTWVSAAIRDVTKRKEIEKTLEESEEKFNKAFHLSPAGLTLTNVTNGKWIEANESFLQMTGYKRDEVIDHTSSELGMISEEERDSMLEEIKKTGSLRNKEVEFKRKSGETGIALFSNERISVKGETVIITTLYDITKRKAAEAELQKKSEELTRSNQELEQFAYVASHDLQEPLRMITSYVQLLEKKYKPKLDGDAIDFINYAVDGASRMQTLIYSLLDYSRINRIKPFENIDLNEIVEESLKDLSIAIQESKASVKYRKLPTVWGDRVLLGQLFFNLIGNAIKFRGKKPVKITISAARGENRGEYYFVVKDNGIGIKKEYQEKIFVIFQRLHTKDRYPGTGIGLAICKKIVERHGGKIWVESVFNKGSSFHFTINTMKKGQNILTTQA